MKKDATIEQDDLRDAIHLASVCHVRANAALALMAIMFRAVESDPDMAKRFLDRLKAEGVPDGEPARLMTLGANIRQRAKWLAEKHADAWGPFTGEADLLAAEGVRRA